MFLWKWEYRNSPNNNNNNPPPAPRFGGGVIRVSILYWVSPNVINSQMLHRVSKDFVGAHGMRIALLVTFTQVIHHGSIHPLHTAHI